MSFWEFCYRNQTFWEEKTLKIEVKQKLKTYNEFIVDLNNGYYNDRKICRPLKTLLIFLESFPEHKEELLEMFNYKMIDLINPSLWEKEIKQ